MGNRQESGTSRTPVSKYFEEAPVDRKERCIRLEGIRDSSGESPRAFGEKMLSLDYIRTS